MKKLGTLKLKNASVLSEREMKQVLGGSGFTGSGSEESEWDCLCFQPHSGALGEDNTPLPPDKKVTVKSNDPRKVYSLAFAACPGYEKVNCI
ncbi:TIGR04149 family rSAM-modified RiPP [Bacteroides sp. ET225]|uniref:TIGR04149 family rSAM-modified RiPP n=1 Tax=Bacteroides sp. ET225 TaxID=2972461 RepID=UPI0021AC9A47|nr:TIGR04149 family rSAM-modified RiPP [Bacteroides sp. ET225]MCR8919416.1 TIGR04149 family rSAM-modified RiPP [Bacteroides sp. ET225]